MSGLRSVLVLLLTALSMAVLAAPIAQATNAADIGNITDIESSSSGSHASGGGQSEGTGNATGSKEGGSKGGSGDALANVVAPVANGDLNGNKVFISVNTLNDILNNASILSNNDDNTVDILKKRTQVFTA